MNNSAAVLRNKGVCIEINQTEQVEGVWEVVRSGDGDPVLTKAWVRMDGNILADLEETWGNLTAYQQATKETPYQAVRRTLSMVFGWDDLHAPNDPSGRLCSGCRRAGLSMREGGLTEYTTAVGAALALANGLDPTKVVAMLAMGVKATKEQEDLRNAALDELLAEAAEEETPSESTSMDGSANGSEPVAATTSSGG